jgi:hypothetical protein
VSYRDDLQAAHARIAALEQELAEIRRRHPREALAVTLEEQSTVNLRLSEILAQMRGDRSPIIRSLPPTRKEWVPYATKVIKPIAFSADVIVSETFRVHDRFRPVEFFATDTSKRRSALADITIATSRYARIKARWTTAHGSSGRRIRKKSISISNGVGAEVSRRRRVAPSRWWASRSTTPS